MYMYKFAISFIHQREKRTLSGHNIYTQIYIVVYFIIIILLLLRVLSPTMLFLVDNVVSMKQWLFDGCV